MKTDVVLKFENRELFRKWLEANCRTSGGVWLLFGKSGGAETLTPSEALEEALCFGWIDGLIKKTDEKTYKKYFAQRRSDSSWSDKNKALAESLENRGLMTCFGREKTEEAKRNGLWYVRDPMTAGEEEIAVLSETLKKYEPAYTNFQAMPKSVKKTYARAYTDAKTEAGRKRRISWIADRLNKNLRPM